MFTRAKVRCLKQVNSLRKDTQIRKNRTKEELTEDNRGKRRRKGTALGAYALVNGAKKFSPDLDLAVIQAGVEKKVNVKSADDESEMVMSAITNGSTDTENIDIPKAASPKKDETEMLRVSTIVCNVQRLVLHLLTFLYLFRRRS